MKRKEIQASRWNAPAEMVRIARERTRDIMQLWASDVAWGPIDFNILAQSCYMQGINDSVDALNQRDLMIAPRTGTVSNVEFGG